MLSSSLCCGKPLIKSFFSSLSLTKNFFLKTLSTGEKKVPEIVADLCMEQFFFLSPASDIFYYYLGAQTEGAELQLF